MNQNNAKSPPDPTAVGPGGKIQITQKKPRRDPTVPQRYRGSSAGLIHRNATKPPGSHRKCGENPGGLVDQTVAVVMVATVAVAAAVEVVVVM